MKAIDATEMASLLRRTHWTDDKDRERQAVAVLAFLQDEPEVMEEPAEREKKTSRRK